MAKQEDRVEDAPYPDEIDVMDRLQAFVAEEIAPMVHIEGTAELMEMAEDSVKLVNMLYPVIFQKSQLRDFSPRECAYLLMLLNILTAANSDHISLSDLAARFLERCV